MLLHAGDQTLVAEHLAGRKLTPAAMLKTLNDALQERRLDSQYVTMLYALWNDENLTLQVANAGAVQPLFCRGEEIETIRAEGFPLGMFPSASWEEFSIATQPGDSVVFFSDGIVESTNGNDEQFGVHRIAAELVTLRSQSPEAIAEAISAAAAAHGTSPDDRSILVIRVL